MYEKKKLLLIMRHAKSDRSEALINDFDRPLNDRGQHQPEVIAHRLNHLGITIDRALISPAQRTYETWTLLESHLVKPPKPIMVKELYNACAEDFMSAVIEHAHDAHHLLVIAHCPGVSLATEFLTGEYHDFKTASLAILSAHNDELAESLNQPRSFRFLEMLTVEE